MRPLLLLFLLLRSLDAFFFGLGSDGGGCSCPPVPCGGAPAPSLGCGMLCPHSAPPSGCGSGGGGQQQQQQQQQYGFAPPQQQQQFASYPSRPFSYPSPAPLPSFNPPPPAPFQSYQHPPQSPPQRPLFLRPPPQNHQNYQPQNHPSYPVGPQPSLPQYLPPPPSRSHFENRPAPMRVQPEMNTLPGSFYANSNRFQPQFGVEPAQMVEGSIEHNQVQVGRTAETEGQQRNFANMEKIQIQPSNTISEEEKNPDDIAQSIEDSYDDVEPTVEKEAQAEVAAPHVNPYQTPVTLRPLKTTEIKMTPTSTTFTRDLLEESDERVETGEETQTSRAENRNENPGNVMAPPPPPPDHIDIFSEYSSSAPAPSSTSPPSVPITMEYAIPNAAVTYKHVQTSTNPAPSQTTHLDLADLMEPSHSDYKTVTRTEGKSTDPLGESGYDYKERESVSREEGADTEAVIPNRDIDYTDNDSQHNRNEAGDDDQGEFTGDTGYGRARDATNATNKSWTGDNGDELFISTTSSSSAAFAAHSKDPNTSSAQRKQRDPTVSKCNSQKLQNIMHEKMSLSAPVSKQLIYSAATSAFPGLSLDVICSRHSFSYIVVTSPIYCEHRKTPLTCFAFFQP